MRADTFVKPQQASTNFCKFSFEFQNWLLILDSNLLILWSGLRILLPGPLFQASAGAAPQEAWDRDGRGGVHHGPHGDRPADMHCGDVSSQRQVCLDLQGNWENILLKHLKISKPNTTTGQYNRALELCQNETLNLAFWELGFPRNFILFLILFSEAQRIVKIYLLLTEDLKIHSLCNSHQHQPHFLSFSGTHLASILRLMSFTELNIRDPFKIWYPRTRLAIYCH